MSESIVWSELTDLQRNTMIAESLLHWRRHPKHSKLWIPAIRPNDDFSDAEQRPTVTLPYFTMDRNAVAIIEKFMIRMMRPNESISLMVQQWNDKIARQPVTLVEVCNDGGTILSSCERFGKYGYCEAICIAALRLSGIDILEK